MFLSALLCTANLVINGNLWNQAINIYNNNYSKNELPLNLKRQNSCLTTWLLTCLVAAADYLSRGHDGSKISIHDDLGLWDKMISLSPSPSLSLSLPPSLPPFLPPSPSLPLSLSPSLSPSLSHACAHARAGFPLSPSPLFFTLSRSTFEFLWNSSSLLSLWIPSMAITGIAKMFPSSPQFFRRIIQQPRIGPQW